MWSSSFRASRSALFFLLALSGWFLGLPSLTAQSTSNSPQQNVPQPSAALSLSRASAELVARLIERSGQINALQATLDAVSESLATSQKELQETSISLEESKKALADFRQSTDDAQKITVDALEQARRERDLYKVVSWTAGGIVIAGGIVVAVVLFRR